LGQEKSGLLRQVTA